MNAALEDRLTGKRLTRWEDRPVLQAREGGSSGCLGGGWSRVAASRREGPHGGSRSGPSSTPDELRPLNRRRSTRRQPFVGRER